MLAHWKLEKISIGRLARILSVVAIALAAGHGLHVLFVKQAGPVRLGQLRPTNIVLMSSGSDLTSPSILTIPEAVPARPLLPDVLALEGPAVPMAPGGGSARASTNCAHNLALDLAIGAIIQVTVLAPCQAGERVVLRHSGLAVTGRLDDHGRLQMDVPALVTDARLEIAFADGKRLEGTLVVEEAREMRRFGVQWQGPEAFAVHGFENGADFGQPGHVSPAQHGVAEGGMLSILGDATVPLPLLAQVYTYPVADVPVEVMVEAAVTQATCGQELLGEVIAVEGGRVEVTELSLAMPDCSGLGDFLVLKNLAAEMKLAAN